MKTRLIISTILCLLLCLLVGCSTPRKLAANTKETGKTEEARSEKSAGDILQYVDTTKREGVEITYTKIEFYPPDASKPIITPAPEPEPKQEPANLEDKKVEPTPKKNQPPNEQGAIKSIEQYTVKHDTEDGGISASVESTDTEKNEVINSEFEKKEAITEEPTADPYRWRYILAIIVILVVVGVVGYFCLRKTNLFLRVASFFKKLFV